MTSPKNLKLAISLLYAGLLCSFILVSNKAKSAGFSSLYKYNYSLNSSLNEEDYTQRNRIPIASFISPGISDTFFISSIHTVSIAASDPDGTISAVKFIAEDSTYVDSTYPYSFDYSPIKKGSTKLLAFAYDNLGRSSKVVKRVVYNKDTTINHTNTESISFNYSRAGARGGSKSRSRGLKGFQFAISEYSDGFYLDYKTQISAPIKLYINDSLITNLELLSAKPYPKTLRQYFDSKLYLGDTVRVDYLGLIPQVLKVHTYKYDNVAPNISFLNPSDSTVIYQDSILNFIVNANDTDGYIDSVHLVIEDTLLVLSGTYSFNYLALDTGIFHSYAIAWDEDGDSSISDTIIFYVEENQEASDDFSSEPSEIFLAYNFYAYNSQVFGTGWNNVDIQIPVTQNQIISANSIAFQDNTASKHSLIVTKAPANSWVDTGDKPYTTSPSVFPVAALKRGLRVNSYDTLGLRVDSLMPNTDYKISAFARTYGYVGIDTLVSITSLGSLKHGGLSDNNTITFEIPVSTDANGNLDFAFFQADSGSMARWELYAFYVREIPAPGTPPIAFDLFVPENEDWNYLVDQLPSGSSLIDDYDSDLFWMRNDSLFTQRSFDYEVNNYYQVAVDTGTDIVRAAIYVQDISGVFDQNGIVDSAVAAKYPGVEVGDYIFFNYTSLDQIYDNTGNVAIAPGKRIWIHGGKEYSKITINFVNAAGSGSSNRTKMTNFLGKVISHGGFELQNPDWLSVTGRYSTSDRTGHYAFTGFDGGYEFRQGTFGLEADAEGSDNGHGVSCQTDQNGVEISFVEVHSGFFSGINMKWNNNYDVHDGMWVHHNYIHDVESEGQYTGSTQSGDQMYFINAVVENNLFLRTGGEAIQTGWLGENSVIRNNVSLNSGMDWKNPFQRYQDGALQVTGKGKVDVLNNLIVGQATVGNIEHKDDSIAYSVAEDTLTISNNLFYATRTDLVHYQFNYDDNTHLKIDGNFYGKLGYDYDEVFTIADTTNSVIARLNAPTIYIALTNNTYDGTVEVLNDGSRTPNLISGNTQANVPRPMFRNYFGMNNNLNFFDLHRYTDTIGTEEDFPYYQTRKDSLASWEVGNIVQIYNANGDTRFYECIQDDNQTGNDPPLDDSDNAYWSLITWTKPDGSISYFPPDDARLISGSFYDSLGMGFLDSTYYSYTSTGGSSLNKAHLGTPDNTEAAASNKISIYPNPSDGLVYFHAGNNFKGELKLFNSSGRLVYQKKVESTFGEHFSIDLNHLPKGLYVLSASSQSINNTLQLVLQ